ncbi:MAG: LysM peptidoglycan-binding domain-containing protein [Verrucomicrobia bacterium]|nr:LysM peptidoglycan-binding domain-containing protein [Verrucomicrobiota bacterium]
MNPSQPDCRGHVWPAGPTAVRARAAGGPRGPRGVGLELKGARSGRRREVLVLAILGAALLAGCGERERAGISAETDEPYYLQGKQFLRQGRNPEALNAFLKTIDRRGESPSPESHLEVGILHLNHTKDFLSACYHFRRYLKAHPNSKQTPYVLGMLDAAKREFARTLPGRPFEDQSVRMGLDEEIGRLRRENDELRAEVAVLRGGGAVPVARSARLIALPSEVRMAPPPVTTVVDLPIVPAPASRPPAQSAPAVAAHFPPREPNSPATLARSGPPAGRTHTVVAKDTLYSIARRYNVRVEEIAAANPATIPTVGAPLRVGTVLKIP